MIRSIVVALALVTAALPATADAASELALARLQHLVRVAPGRAVPAALRVDDPTYVPVLESLGVRFRRGTAGLRRVGAIHAVDADPAVLELLARLGWTLEVPQPGPDEPSPTDVIGLETQTWALQAMGPLPSSGPIGRGVTVLDIDAGFDLFHPHAFAADAGAWPWLDVDDDGLLTPGIDGIDLDDDGVLAVGEVLQLLDHADPYAAADGVLDPSVDYLYLDRDGSGAREHGPQFGEATPGYGEPMFLPDDADGDGSIGVDERMLQLGSSRLRALRWHDTVWRRGVDLVESAGTITGTSTHATATTGILVGGQDRLFRRHRGLADGVDLVLFDRTDAGGDPAAYVDAFAWGIDDEGADVVLHEYSGWSTIALDGSGLREQAIDAASAQGVVNVCPAGNLRRAERHARTTAQPVSFAYDVPASPTGTPLWLTLHWRDPSVELDCELHSPSGQSAALVPGQTPVLDALAIEVTRWDTERGTAILNVEMLPPDGDDPALGRWQVTCNHDAASPLTVDAYLADDVTFWTPFIAFVDPVVEQTMCMPSTADACISVGAYAYQFPGTGEVGALAVSSGTGPRIDDGRTIDLAAPNDPVVPQAHTDNGFTVVGGTSSAVVSVTAAVAQLLELDPTATPAEIRARLQAGATVDAHVGAGPFPDDAWGFGKLNAWAAAAEGPAPTTPGFVGTWLSVAFEAGETCTARVQVEDVDWDDASFRWDDDYDGAWDGDFEPAQTRDIAVDPITRHVAVRVEFGQAGWRVGGAAITAEAPASCFAGGGGSSSGGADESGGGSEDGGSTDGEASSSDGAATGTSSDTAAGSDDGEASGCGCTHTPAGPGAWAWIVALGWRRRRRAR